MTFCNIEPANNKIITRVLRDLLADDDVEKIARAIVEAHKNGGDAAVDKLMKDAGDPKFGAKVRMVAEELWINSILSGPHTHIVNIVGNAMVPFVTVAERGTAAMIGRAFGKGEVAKGEAPAMLFGLMNGYMDGLRAFGRAARAQRGQTFKGDGISRLYQRGKALKEGVADALEASLDPLTKVETGKYNAITAAKFGLSEGTTLASAVDLMGGVIRIPGSALTLADNYFKFVGRRMELNALAYRTATDEGLKGAALQNRMAEIINNPPDEIMNQAITTAQYQTYTKRLGPAGEKLQRAVAQAPGMRFVLPFIRTPTNIMKYVGERTPISWVAPSVRDEILAGGARRDVALAKMTLGSLTMGLGATMAAAGFVTGAPPSDKGLAQAMRRNGWQPYSIRVGDTWVAYNRLDPLGATLGIAADMQAILSLDAEAGEFGADAEAIERARQAVLAEGGTEDKANELAERMREAGGLTINDVLGATVIAVGNNLINKTYMSGVADLVEMFSTFGNSDLAANRAKSYLQNMALGFVPFSSAQRQAERMVDPTLRASQGLVEAYKANTPGLSGSLPPVRDLWGKPRTHWTSFSPFAMSFTGGANETLADKELIRLGGGVGMPRRVFSFEGSGSVKMSEEEFSEFVRLAGNELKDPETGLGAREAIEAMIKGEHPGASSIIRKSVIEEINANYAQGTDGPEGTRLQDIKAIISDYRKAAKSQVIAKFPSLRRLALERAQYRKDARSLN